MAEVDQITIATRRFISTHTNRLIDNIFTTNPLIAVLRTLKPTLKPKFVGEEEDEFDTWAREVRAQAQLPAHKPNLPG